MKSSSQFHRMLGQPKGTRYFLVIKLGLLQLQRLSSESLNGQPQQMAYLFQREALPQVRYF
jgi:hypothetical protein